MDHPSLDALNAGLDAIRRSPRDRGRLELLVRRPAVDEREELTEGELDPAVGLVGDTWKGRPSRFSDDGGAHPDMQLNLMNARAIALLAGDPSRWALAGDQLYLDLDLGVENLSAGTRLAIGSAVIEVTAMPHRGCAKFAQRFGRDAVRWVNSPEGRQLKLRGVNAKVVVGGTIRLGDVATKVGPATARGSGGAERL